MANMLHELTMFHKYPRHMKARTKRIYRTLLKMGYLRAAAKLVPLEDLNINFHCFGDYELLRRTRVSSAPETIQRAILELVALKMCKEARQSLVLPEDDLYVKVRRPQNSPYFHAIRQQWYKKTEKGQRRLVNSLYMIIQHNPQAILQMLAK